MSVGPPRAGRPRVEISADPEAFRALDWSPAVEADPDGTFFHTPAYLKLWWEEFGTGSLAVAVARGEGDDQPLAGGCAFEVEDGTLRFLGGFDVTDYLGPVAFPSLREGVAEALMDAVSGLAWDRADLRGIPVDSPWLVALEGSARRRGWTVARGEDGVAPLVEIPGSFEGYLDALPAKLRHEIRRKERRLVGEGGPTGLRFATPESLGEDLEWFLSLHRRSPGPKGRFMHAGMEIFFRRLAEAFLPPHVLHLGFLEIGGVRAAGAIGFGFKDTFSLYNSAFDRAFASVAPGVVLVAGVIRLAAEQGRRRFDLLKGDLEYKYRFGARPRPIGSLAVTR